MMERGREKNLPGGHLESSLVTMSIPWKRLFLKSSMFAEAGNRPVTPEMTMSNVFFRFILPGDDTVRVPLIK